jgi:hypothetical protein
VSRASVRRELADQLQSALLTEDVSVTVGSASTDVPHEGVWLWDPVTSTIEVPALAGGTSAIRDDIYSFQIRVVTAVPGRDAIEAEQRVNDLTDIIEESVIVNRASQLGSNVLSILPADLQGPITGPTPEGVMSAMYLTIEVHERKGP